MGSQKIVSVDFLYSKADRLGKDIGGSVGHPNLRHFHFWYLHKMNLLETFQVKLSSRLWLSFTMRTNSKNSIFFKNPPAFFFTTFGDMYPSKKINKTSGKVSCIQSLDLPTNRVGRSAFVIIIAQFHLVVVLQDPGTEFGGN